MLDGMCYAFKDIISLNYSCLGTIVTHAFLFAQALYTCSVRNQSKKRRKQVSTKHQGVLFSPKKAKTIQDLLVTSQVP